MNLKKLVGMANSIGAFFAAESNRADALEGIASHIRRFWDPRMRAQLIAGFDRGECTDASPLVIEAIAANRERLLGGTVRPGEPPRTG